MVEIGCHKNQKQSAFKNQFWEGYRLFGFRPAAGEGSVAKQLGAYLRGIIENGSLSPGFRLPPTRKAAQEIGIARNIVIEVYEQLTAEGVI